MHIMIELYIYTHKMHDMKEYNNAAMIWWFSNNEKQKTPRL